MKTLIIAFALICGIARADFASLSKDIMSNASLGASVNSYGIKVDKVDLLSIQAVWTGGGSPVGDFTIEVSNDDVDIATPDQAGNVVNWSTYPGSIVSIAADGDLAYNISSFAYKWIRLKYTRTSGTATINAKLVVKANNK